MPLPDSVPPAYENLRFAPRDIVSDYYDRVWKRGKILDCSIYQYDPPQRNAYRILCEDDDFAVHAPNDSESFLRPPLL